MRPSPQSAERDRCPVCRAALGHAAESCAACGEPLAETPAREIQSINYLLSEIARWEESGALSPEQARALREDYERRREELRAQLLAAGKGAAQSALQPPRRPPPPAAPRRKVLETLADPQTIRLLLYTGAGMLVVGVIIWLRDILYLKLREPVVQAALLAIGTTAVTAAGWLTILRTRLLLTGRALTLVGSLLVPVNFWFLARSGLVESSGRAWFVCALCALLYAQTAAVLREKLYVYLACAAATATAWTLVYRFEPQAAGLYAFTLMSLSLAFLHLSLLFPMKDDGGRAEAGGTGRADTGSDSKAGDAGRLASDRMSRELWGPPLVHVGLVGAALAALLYMPVRLGSTPSFRGGVLRLRSAEYDPSVAILLWVLAAYAAWLAGRHVYQGRRAPLYTVSALALLWAEFLALDGLRVSGPTQLLALAATAFAFVLVSRGALAPNRSAPLRRAGLVVAAALAALSYPVLAAHAAGPAAHSVILLLLAATYAASGAPRGITSADTHAHAAAVFAFAMTLAAQALIHMRAGDPSLLAPSMVMWTFGALLLGVGLRAGARARYLRAGLYSLVLAFVLACLRAGLDPSAGVESYTTPVAALLLVAGALYARGKREAYEADAGLLLWAGSVLFSAPLLVRALEYRLLLGVPAPARDLATLLASLALILLGVLGRLRAPLIAGAASLLLELVALAVTSVDWLQVSLKAYLISAGALILLVWGLLEFRREQVLLLRHRLSERRDYARQRFGEWK